MLNTTFSYHSSCPGVNRLNRLVVSDTSLSHRSPAETNTPMYLFLCVVSSVCMDALCPQIKCSWHGATNTYTHSHRDTGAAKPPQTHHWVVDDSLEDLFVQVPQLECIHGSQWKTSHRAGAVFPLKTHFHVKVSTTCIQGYAYFKHISTHLLLK